MAAMRRPVVNARTASFYRAFHDYFVTHLPSSSLHPDSKSAAGPRHQLPRSASKPHDISHGRSPAQLPGHRDTTVVRIPLRSAKHHFGVTVSRGQRPYNEDSYQAGVIDLPTFAKKSPRSVTRAPTSSPLQAYREKKEREQAAGNQDGEAQPADGIDGDPQVFYFGVFDGHGGTECSGYLRENLHNSIEETAKKYGLQSSLRPKAPTTPSDSSATSAQNLEDQLITSWRKNIGGYFRRFSPKSFTSPAVADMPTILTHAFLASDLSLLLAPVIDAYTRPRRGVRLWFGRARLPFGPSSLSGRFSQCLRRAASISPARKPSSV